MSQRLLREDRDGLCTLTLNRPDKLNALDGLMFDELDAITTVLERETDRIGCVVLRANGRCFSAGADIGGVGVEKRDPGLNSKILERFSKLPQPIVVAIHGVCFTGGLELALSGDFLVADKTARFADTHGRFGFVAMWGMTQRLPRRVGLPAAKRMMMTARPIDAAQALEIGLVDELADEGMLNETLDALTASILANSWFTNFGNKRILVETQDMPLSKGLEYEVAHWPGSAPDSKERIAKFTKT
ncbi:MAG: enoyl-CoA hydratase/isomerase family protein [Sphingomonadaceae bacterium]|nr:enoyl-CoA hydratase/isomerase family protein [Sphingomonadaceae bacterium]